MTETPDGLAERGQRFWSNVVDVYDIAEAERELLLEACRALDLADQLQKVIDTDGPMSTGSRGQRVAHPALNQLHSIRNVLTKLLSSLNFPGEEKVWSDASRRAQHASRSRWDQDAEVREIRKKGPQ